MTMRFFGGLIGGSLAASSSIYLATTAHIQTRTAQRALLRQQVDSLSRLCAGDGQEQVSILAAREAFAAENQRRPIALPLPAIDGWTVRHHHGQGGAASQA